MEFLAGLYTLLLVAICLLQALLLHRTGKPAAQQDDEALKEWLRQQLEAQARVLEEKQAQQAQQNLAAMAHISDTLQTAVQGMSSTLTAGQNTQQQTMEQRLQGLEARLREKITGCLEHPLLDGPVQEGTLEDMIKQLREAESFVQRKSQENENTRTALAQICAELEKTQDLLEKAQGEDTERLKNAGEQLNIRKQETLTAVAEVEATLKTLAELPFEDWKTAENEVKKAAQAAEDILTEINEAERQKKEADLAVASLHASLTTQNETLQNQQKLEKIYKEHLETAVREQKFASLDEMLSYVTEEEAIAGSEETLSGYRQKCSTNHTQLEQAERDAEGKAYVDMDALNEACQEKERAVQELRREVNEEREKLGKKPIEDEDDENHPQGVEAHRNPQKRLFPPQTRTAECS